VIAFSMALRGNYGRSDIMAVATKESLGFQACEAVKTVLIDEIMVFLAFLDRRRRGRRLVPRGGDVTELTNQLPSLAQPDSRLG